MYEYIKGNISEIYPSYLVIENNGIGFHLLMANPFRLTDAQGKETTLFVYQHVSQDDIQLFGFKNREEKILFLKLIAVSGIGPKSALAILANDDHAGLINAIEKEDTKFLQKFPGVGKKTAAQIVLDLQGKLAELSIENYSGGNESNISNSSSTSNVALEEAVEALFALGYGQREVKKARKEMEKLDKLTTDQYIREALKAMMKK